VALEAVLVRLDEATRHFLPGLLDDREQVRGLPDAVRIPLRYLDDPLADRTHQPQGYIESVSAARINCANAGAVIGSALAGTSDRRALRAVIVLAAVRTQ
jgi:hypothetical protein